MGNSTSAVTNETKPYHPLVNGMGMVHTAVQNNFHTLKNYKDEDTSPKQRKLFCEFSRMALNMLLNHAAAEDAYFFPTLKEKVPDLDLSLMEKQHSNLDSKLRTVLSMYDELEKDFTNTSLLRDKLIPALAELYDATVEHLNAEDALLTAQFFDSHFTQEEQKAMGKVMSKKGKEDMKNTSIEFPLLVYSLDSASRDQFFSLLPWILKGFLIPYVWYKSYEPYVQFFYDCPFKTEQKQ